MGRPPIAVQLHILLVFDLNSVEIVGTVDHQRHPQAAECACVHLPSKQLECLSDSYTQLLQPPEVRIIGLCCLYHRLIIRIFRI